ncbi:MAG: transcriptional regulator GutM [Coriobacteriia bacterium]|nr:transcriptional regulator GutM [Coriobacteriia bacterium]
MEIVITLGIVLGIAFLLQTAFSMLQMKHFSHEFVKLKKKGRVAVGRKNGAFFAGAIVMFQIDGDGIIQQAKYMEGVTVLARFKDLPGFEGKDISKLTEKDGPEKHRNLKKAIADAANNYNTYEGGGVIENPPSLFKKIGNLIKGGK